MQSHASLVALAAAMIALSACGGGGGGSSPPPVGTPPPPPPPPPPTNNAPDITSADASVTELSLDVYTATATDADGDTLSWSLAGTDDDALFAIDSAAGTLRFRNAPDFEAPADADADNVYTLTLGVNDGQGGSDQETVSVTVTDLVADKGVALPHYVSNAGVPSQSFVATVYKPIDDLDGDGRQELLAQSTRSPANSPVAFPSLSSMEALFSPFLDGVDTPTVAFSDFAGHRFTFFETSSVIAPRQRDQYALQPAGGVDGLNARDVMLRLGRVSPGVATEKWLYFIDDAVVVPGGSDQARLADLTYRLELDDIGPDTLVHIGDIDGNGEGDLAIGTNGLVIAFDTAFDSPGTQEVRVLQSTANLTTVTGLAALDITGSYNVVLLPDLDGDGGNEVAVFQRNALSLTGTTISDADIVIISSREIVAARGGTLDVSSPRAGGVVKIDPGNFDPSRGEVFARNVGSAGDVDGDGTQDIVIGRRDPANGQVAVILSGAAVMADPDGMLLDTDLDTSSRVRLMGIPRPGENLLIPGGVDRQFGTIPRPANAAEDVDGDGAADVLIHDIFTDPDVVVRATASTGYAPPLGASYVVYGSALAFGDDIDLTADADVAQRFDDCELEGGVTLTGATLPELHCSLDRRFLDGDFVQTLRGRGVEVVDANDLLPVVR